MSRMTFHAIDGQIGRTVVLRSFSFWRECAVVLGVCPLLSLALMLSVKAICPVSVNVPTPVPTANVRPLHR